MTRDEPDAPHMSEKTCTWSGVEISLRRGSIWSGQDDLSAPGPRLFAMLDEAGGHLEARLRRDHGSLEGFRGSRHLSFVPAGTEVWGHCDRPATFAAVFIRFSEELLEEAGAQGWLADARPRLMFDDPLLWQLAANLASEVEDPTSGSVLLVEGVAQALAVRTARAQLQAPRRKGGLAGWQLRRVTEYLNAYHDRDIAIADLAAIAGLSMFHFARAFKASTGVSPGRYQMLIRLERAKRMLRETDMKLVDVALEIGFDAQHSLSRLFRREVGVAPLRYRQSHRN